MALPTSYRRVLVNLFKLAILAIVVWAGHRTITAALDDLGKHGWNFNRLHPGWMVACGVLCIVSQVPCAWFWHRALVGLGQPVSLGRAVRAYFVGHLGKYVPGKAMVIVLRVALIHEPSVKPAMAVVAVFYEAFVTMACGAAVAALILLVGFRDQPVLIAISIGLALATGLPTLPAVFTRLLRLARLVPADPTLTDRPIHLPVGDLLVGWLTIALGWVLCGASLWAAARAIGVQDTTLWRDLPLYTASVTLAVVLGFVSMLPAGLGVRDIVLAQLLAPRLGDSSALVAAIVLRLAWLLADALFAAALYPIGRKPKQPPTRA